MQERKLFLLDGMALVYRAFFAFSQNPRITRTGINASAMLGFTNTLLDIPDYDFSQIPKFYKAISLFYFYLNFFLML